MTQIKQIERCVKRDGKVLTIEEGEPLSAAARKMREHHVGSLVVMNKRRDIIGIVTERDILSAVATREQPGLARVSEVMTPKIFACNLRTPIEKAQRVMACNGIRHLPIIEDGLLVGMISSRDILSHQLARSQEIVQMQSQIINDLEKEHPGITDVAKDDSGRVVIGGPAGP